MGICNFTNFLDTYLITTKHYLRGIKLIPKMRIKMEKAFESIIQSISAFYGTTNAKTIDQSILQRFIWLVITVDLCCRLFSTVKNF